MSANTFPLLGVALVPTAERVRDFEARCDDGEFAFRRARAGARFFLERVEDINYLAESNGVHEAVGSIGAWSYDLGNLSQRALHRLCRRMYAAFLR